MAQKEDIKLVLEKIRSLIRESGISQRKVEEKVGFSRGYLSQLLARNLDLKVWHLLAVLDVLGRHPGEIFTELYPVQRRSVALDAFVATSQPLTAEMDEVLGRLYGLGIESLSELRGRVARCEQAVTELENLGIVRTRAESGEG